MATKKTVDDYLIDAVYWQAELMSLRRILISTELSETIKWGMPCYTYSGQNIVGIGGFKSYFGLWFHQGVFLSDPAKVLINAQTGKTKALRQWRMGAANEINPPLIKDYVAEAIELSRKGVKIPITRNKPLIIPAELKVALENDTEAQKVFEEMRLGLKREYADYIASAKRAETKSKRLEKIIPMIKENIGLSDKYR